MAYNSIVSAHNHFSNVPSSNLDKALADIQKKLESMSLLNTAIQDNISDRTAALDNQESMALLQCVAVFDHLSREIQTDLNSITKNFSFRDNTKEAENFYDRLNQISSSLDSAISFHSNLRENNIFQQSLRKATMIKNTNNIEPSSK